MKNNFYNKPIGNINLRPSYNSEVTSQILYGEKFKILSKNKEWIKIRTEYDNYTGYIKRYKFLRKFRPTNKICKPKSIIFRKKGDKFFKTKNFLYFGSRISVITKKKEFFEYEKRKWVKIVDTKKVDHFEKNLTKILKLFLNTKYLWGGKSSKGIDCSALIQIFFFYNRIFFPRDTKDQLRYCRRITDKKNFKKNIIFWKGHVAYRVNKKNLIHAYGPKKKVLIMNIKKTINRIFKDTKLKPINL